MVMELLLRDVKDSDLSIFFMQQVDQKSNYMAAFTAKDPADRGTFWAHWQKIMTDATILIQTIICCGQVAGYVLSYENESKPEVSYWLGEEYWGKGIASWALAEFLKHNNLTRPIYARVAKDNLGSRRVLEKCGFELLNTSTGFANARGCEIEELLLSLSQ